MIVSGFEAFVQAVVDERQTQLERWGDQQHPAGTGGSRYRQDAAMHRSLCQAHAAEGNVSWADILLEEVYEALAERDPEALRRELVQVVAVGFAWIEDLDRAQSSSISVRRVGASTSG